MIQNTISATKSTQDTIFINKSSFLRPRTQFSLTKNHFYSPGHNFHEENFVFIAHGTIFDNKSSLYAQDHNFG